MLCSEKNVAADLRGCTPIKKQLKDGLAGGIAGALK
jgi:hypothetical protein